MNNNQLAEKSARARIYRDLLRAVPGLDGMYRLVAALIADRSDEGHRVLIAGAGGGREIEALGASVSDLDITAVDPSAENLKEAERAAASTGAAERIVFFRGMVDDLPSRPVFDIATSLLVMHHLRDDGAKLGYLKALKDRLGPRGILLHADVCFDGAAEFDHVIPAYLAHAKLVGVAVDVARIEIDAVSRLPIVSVTRTRDLFEDAGFSPPREIFRSLWYRCWLSSKVSP